MSFILDILSGVACYLVITFVKWLINRQRASKKGPSHKD